MDLKVEVLNINSDVDVGFEIDIKSEIRVDIFSVSIEVDVDLKNEVLNSEYVDSKVDGFSVVDSQSKINICSEVNVDLKVEVDIKSDSNLEINWVDWVTSSKTDLEEEIMSEIVVDSKVEVNVDSVKTTDEVDDISRLNIDPNVELGSKIIIDLGIEFDNEPKEEYVSVVEVNNNSV